MGCVQNLSVYPRTDDCCCDCLGRHVIPATFLAMWYIVFDAMISLYYRFKYLKTKHELEEDPTLAGKSERYSPALAANTPHPNSRHVADSGRSACSLPPTTGTPESRLRRRPTHNVNQQVWKVPGDKPDGPKDSLRSLIWRQLNAGNRVWLTGHSKGGAVATTAASRLLLGDSSVCTYMRSVLIGQLKLSLLLFFSAARSVHA